MKCRVFYDMFSNVVFEFRTTVGLVYIFVDPARKPMSSSENGNVNHHSAILRHTCEKTGGMKIAIALDEYPI